MKVLCAVLAFLSVGAVSGAQEQNLSKKPPHSSGSYDVDAVPTMEQPSLQVGPVTVRLGMTMGELEAKLSGAELVKAQEDMWLIGYKGEQPVAGNVLFKNGVVVVATRSWLTGGSDVAQAVLGAIDSFTQEGLRDCTIASGVVSLPTARTQTAKIQCGVKWIMISKGKFESIGKSAGFESEDVDEGIGSN